METPATETPLDTADSLSELVEAVIQTIDSEQPDSFDVLADFEGDATELLEALPLHHRDVLWKTLSEPQQATVLADSHDQVREHFLSQCSVDEVLALLDQLSVDDRAQLTSQLPEELQDEVLDRLDAKTREAVTLLERFEDESVGAMMHTEFRLVSAGSSGSTAARTVVRAKDAPVFVRDTAGTVQGYLDPRALVDDASRDKRVNELMNEIPTVSPTLTEHEISRLFVANAWELAVVVDDDNRPIGFVPAVDIVDILSRESEAAMLAGSGMDEDEDLFSPVRSTMVRRNVWLGVNLLTALLASWVIGLFEATLDQVVALAILMPVVASMGGIAGSQTLALIIRGLALDQISPSNGRALLIRELKIGFGNGLLWSVAIGLVAWQWFGSVALGFVIAAAIVINLVAAAMSGVVVPVTLQRFGADPALAGGVVLTTVTDVVGFLAFLGLGSLFLLGANIT